MSTNEVSVVLQGMSCSRIQRSWINPHECCLGIEFAMKFVGICRTAYECQCKEKEHEEKLGNYPILSLLVLGLCEKNLESGPSSALSNMTLSSSVLNLYFRKVHTECVHVQAIKEASKVLIEPRKTLMHQLQMHKVGLQICHRVRQFCKRRFKSFEGE